MMMAATRRSFRARKTSPKSKKRSRRSDHDHHGPDQQYRSIEYSHPEETDRRNDGDRKYRSSSAPSGVSSRHGDMGDSGIDSGNGHVEPESSVQARLGHSSSEHVNVRQIRENQYPSSPKRRIRASEASVTSSDNYLQKDTSDEKFASRANVQAHHSDETRSRHRKRKTSESEENLQKTSSVREKASVVNHEHEELSSSADNTSVAETQSRTDKPHSTRSVSQDSETSSISSNDADQQLKLKEEKKVVNGLESKRTDDVAKDSEESSESEQETSDSANDDRKQLDAMSVTSERRKRKRKLQARLEQAKHSLASPHINAAVEAYESSAGSLAGPQAVCLLQEFRRLFHQELIRLRLELDTFRHFCSKQMESEAESVFSRHRDRQTEEETKEDTVRQRNDCCTQTKEAEGDGSKGKKVNNPELDDWEEKLTARQNDLLDYEKEILEVETMLNQRQAICERRQSALLVLDEELQSLREDIFSKKENLKSDSDTNVERARKNWDLVRRHLTDKQAMLEAAVQRYKTQIASSNAALAAKDTLIAHLQKQMKESQETLKARDKKIGHLENKLVLATEEVHVLHSRQDPGPQPPDTDPLSLSQTRRASLRPGSGLLQRQRSEASDRSGAGRGSSVRSSASDTQQNNSTALERNSSYRTGSERRKSTAHLPDTVLARGKSSSNLTRSQSARDRRKHQRRNSTAGTGEEAVNSAACAIL